MPNSRTGEDYLDKDSKKPKKRKRHTGDLRSSDIIEFPEGWNANPEGTEGWNANPKDTKGRIIDTKNWKVKKKKKKK